MLRDRAADVGCGSWRPTAAVGLDCRVTTERGYPTCRFFEAEGIKRAHLVTIDTEGWDGRVLAGMRRVIEARRADLIEL